MTEALPADPPKEFRIFRAGVNRTHKGDVLFDEEAARQLIANAATWGVRHMIDLNHDSLDAGPSARVDASDARGWFDLEVRDGELWAVNVEWTPDGERRIRERTQRYISPAFNVDGEGRPVDMVNAALCSMPATFSPQDLIAAKRLSAQVGAPVLALGSVNGQEVFQFSGRTWALEGDGVVEVVPAYVSPQLAAKLRAARFLDKVRKPDGS